MAEVVPDILRLRRRESERRFTGLKRAVSRALGDRQPANACIYATGSYGRGESSPASDMDLFMVDTAEAEDARLGNIDQTVLKAKLISVCEKRNLPPFSGDGEYLEVHLLSGMVAMLGGRQDDAVNAFTARLLLMLESRCLFNEPVYEHVIGRVIAEYFRDYPGREKRFLPAFLVNDIVRYWKTVCLNYEHGRGERRDELVRSSKLRREYKLKNLKLKFSRVLTCYSALAMLAWLERRGAVSPDDVLAMVQLSPTQRIEKLATECLELHEPAARVLSEYAWFLENLSTDKASAVALLASAAGQRRADGRARAYREAFYELVNEAGKGGRLTRYVLM